MKKILLVTHHDLSDPGIISSLLHSKYLTCNINYKNLPLLKQSEIKEYTAIIIFGGKMSANSKSTYIKNEYKFLSKAIKLKKIIIGICLGAQIIAKFYGSIIQKSSSGEKQPDISSTSESEDKTKDYAVKRKNKALAALQTKLFKLYSISFIEKQKSKGDSRQLTYKLNKKIRIIEEVTE